MDVRAVIDIGTLKVKFLIASVDKSGAFHELYSSNELTCFGCDLDNNNGIVVEKYLANTIQELLRCKLLLIKHKVSQYKVVSTHAMRRAKNRDAIIKRIKEEVGFDVENISQEEEAELFFNAVIRDLPQTDKEYAIVDVGGGSVQILVGNRHGLRASHMMQSGAQYLHDNFTKDPSNPASFTTIEDIERMKEHVLHQLLPFEPGVGMPIVYGSSNIINLMKAVGLPLAPNENTKRHPYKTYAKHLETFIETVLPLAYGEREQKFPFQKGYMWGVDKAFLNITLIADKLGSPIIIPSNENIAKGIIYTLG